MRLTNVNPTANDLAIFAAFKEWMDAHGRRDLDAMKALMDPLIFSVGTGVEENWYSRDSLMNGYERDFEESNDIRLQPDGEVTIRSGDDWGCLLFVASYIVIVRGETIRYPSRRTVVYRKEGGKWLQCHGHFSVPDKDQMPTRSYPLGPTASNWYMLLFSVYRDGILVASRDSRRILEANMTASRMYGIPENDMDSFFLDDLMSEKELKLLTDSVEQSNSKGCTFTSVHKDAHGCDMPVEVGAVCTEIDNQNVILLSVRDITEQIKTEKALRLSEDRLRMATEFNEDILWELEIPTMDIHIDGMGGRFGDRRTVPLSKWKKWIHPQDREKVESALRKHLDGGEEFRVECRIRTPERRWMWTLNRGRLADASGGETQKMLGTMMNIDRRKKIEEERAHLTKELEEMASIDQLTGTLNRQRFDRLLQAKMDASKGKRPLCLLMFDLDHFKDINDISGHQKGDQVLKDVSRAVSRRLRRDDLFCRWGGDEFMVALETDLPRSELVANDLRQVISVSVDDGAFPVSASFGIAPWDGAAPLSELTAQADDAMYRAKKSGRNRVVVFGSGEYH